MNSIYSLMTYSMILLQDVLDEVVVLPPPDLIDDAASGAWADIFPFVSRLMIAIGGIVGLLAAIKIYNNWQTGVDNIFHACMNLLLGSMVLILLGGAIAAYFVNV